MIVDVTGNVEFQHKLQSMHVDQLHTIATAWIRQMEALEGVLAQPRLMADEGAEEILNAEFDRLSEHLRIIAEAIARWTPATKDEARERTFAVAYLAYHRRMTPDEFLTETTLQ